MADTFTLRLVDGADSIDFVDDSNGVFFLLDGTFEAEPPRTRIKESKSLDGENGVITGISLENRKVNFSFQVRTSSQSGLMTQLNRVYRMFGRAMNQKTLLGGSVGGDITGYNGPNLTGRGTVTGDAGLRLVVRYGAAEGTILSELNDTYTNSREFTFKVVSGEMNIVRPFSVEGSARKGATYMLLEVEVELECEPLALGEPRIIARNANGFYAGSWPDPGLSAGQSCKYIIPGNLIDGTHDALTRIYMGGNNNQVYLPGGLIIGRDAGRSLLNCPSSQTHSGSSPGPGIIPYGYYTGAPEAYIVEVASVTSDTDHYPTLRWVIATAAQLAGGAIDTWRGVQQITSAYTPVWIRASEVGFIVPSTNWSSAAPGTRFIFYSHQTAKWFSSEFNLYTNRVEFMSEQGVYLPDINVNYLIQPGVTGKYKVLMGIVEYGYTSTDFEYKASHQTTNAYYQIGGGGPVNDTGWVRFHSDVNMGLIDLGVIDLTAQGLPGVSHPLGLTLYGINIKLRGINPPDSNSKLEINSIMLVPITDDNSYMRMSFVGGGTGNLVMSNFDAEAPYMGIINRNMGTSLITEYVTGYGNLKETHEGNLITLVPGVDNTIVAYPMFGAVPDGDYRTAFPADATERTGTTIFAIRPRYMFVG